MPTESSSSQAPSPAWAGFSRKQHQGYPASSVYLAFQFKLALYTTVHTWVEGRGHKGLNSDICLHRRSLDNELLLSAAEPLFMHSIAWWPSVVVLAVATVTDL